MGYYSVRKRIQLHATTGVNLDMCVCVCVCLVYQSNLTLCDPKDYSPPGSSVHGILQARILCGLVVPSSGDLHNPGTELGSPALQADSLPSEPPGKPKPG